MAGETSVGLQQGTADETRKLTVQIVAVHVANNNVATSDLPALIDQVYSALSGLGEARRAREGAASAGRIYQEVGDARLHRLP